MATYYYYEQSRSFVRKGVFAMFKTFIIAAFIVAAAAPAVAVPLPPAPYPSTDPGNVH